MLGVGGLLLSDLLRLQAIAAPRNGIGKTSPTETAVILLFVHGGPSQLETYDLKPERQHPDNHLAVGVLVIAFKFQQPRLSCSSAWELDDLWGRATTGLQEVLEDLHVEGRGGVVFGMPLNSDAVPVFFD